MKRFFSITGGVLALSVLPSVALANITSVDSLTSSTIKVDQYIESDSGTIYFNELNFAIAPNQLSSSDNISKDGGISGTVIDSAVHGGVSVGDSNIVTLTNTATSRALTNGGDLEKSYSKSQATFYFNDVNPYYLIDYSFSANGELDAVGNPNSSGYSIAVTAYDSAGWSETHYLYGGGSNPNTLFDNFTTNTNTMPSASGFGSFYIYSPNQLATTIDVRATSFAEIGNYGMNGVTVNGQLDFNVTASQTMNAVSPVPEPSSALMMLIGLLGVFSFTQRKNGFSTLRT